MDRNFLVMFTFLTLLVSITMYVNDAGIPKQSDKVEAKFLNLGEQLGEQIQEQTQEYNKDCKEPTKLSEQNEQNPESLKKFTVEVLEVKETALLTRDIKARLTNNYEDVRNVEIKFELKLDGERIKINGKDYIMLYIGNMKKGESVVREVEVNIDFFDGIKIRDKGYVDAILTVFYDGGSETAKYRLNV